jgi:hypothetical protein
MRYFLDTEFIESGGRKPIHLLSIALVSEAGREYYAESADAPRSEANEWVKANVFPSLNKILPKPEYQIVRDILTFCNPATYGKPEFWGYYADYDWVVFCQLFGSMSQLPKDYPMYCRDLKQWCDDLGNHQLPEQGKNEHHALSDARWNRRVYEFLGTCPVIGRSLATY